MKYKSLIFAHLFIVVTGLAGIAFFYSHIITALQHSPSCEQKHDISNNVRKIKLAKHQPKPCISNTANKSNKDAWDALTDEFTLNHQVNNPEVQKQIKKLIKHPEDLNNMMKQAKPYLYHILEEIKKRNLPGEIALIPMIESEYDPFVSSHKGAAGLWQIMPHTGSELGLIKNWWVDGRRSIGPSTNAALNYLEYLHRFFHGNWILAFGAYNAGEGTVLRAVKHSNKHVFWSLPLPHETKAYVPKLLALSEIIQNPERYHVKRPEIPQKPYFKEVEISNKLDLNHAAKLTQVPREDLHRLNPGFRDWSTRPTQPYKLLIPTEHVSDFYRNLANISKPAKPNSFLPKLSLTKKHTTTNQLTYVVKKGDSVERIAHQYHLKLTAFKTLNPSLSDRKLRPGQHLIISLNA